MRIFWTILATLGALAVLGLLVLFSGVYNVAANKPHLPATEWALDQMKTRSIVAHARDITVPPLDDSALVMKGAGEYREMCVTCHAGPGVERSPIGKGMTPTPPLLAKTAPEWTDAQLYWMIRNGIKMAGMPGFGETHDDRTIWSMVAFVRRLPRMSPAQYKATMDAVPEEGEEHTGDAEHGEAGHSHRQ